MPVKGGGSGDPRNKRPGATDGGSNSNKSGTKKPSTKPPSFGADTTRPISGSDTDGNSYKDVKDMWSQELQHEERYDREKGWYGKALQYWENAPATMDGVLGGIDNVHDIDITGSKDFIAALGPSVGRSLALDCGAGIGRVSKHLVLPLGFEKVDLLEPVPAMIEQAHKELDPATINKVYLTSIELADLPKEPTYDLVVIQWVAIYLTDDDFIAFLRRCKQALKSGGVVFFKENCSSGGKFYVDKSDSSLTRGDAHYKRIFSEAGVKVVKEATQKGWPSDLLKVKMYALQ